MNNIQFHENLEQQFCQRQKLFRFQWKKNSLKLKLNGKRTKNNLKKINLILSKNQKLNELEEKKYELDSAIEKEKELEVLEAEIEKERTFAENVLQQEIKTLDQRERFVNRA